ncbi:MAG: elongation factor P [Chloroflexi bacterium]|nr:elongation factor P [Chloroflexota bacterium]MDA1297418.1 elongation factor P [Chloroflexota bacterium]
MTISSGEIRRNMTILLEDGLFQILDWQHRQAPKAPPTLTLKVRQISTGNVYERKLPGNQKLTAAPTERRSVQYLYEDGELYTFMDNTTFAQFQMGASLMGDALKFISEGDSCEVLFYDEKPVLVDLPSSVVLTVEQTEPGIRGDTQSSANKPATTNTGLTLNVPLFVNQGDHISVSTSTGEYLGRAD